MFQIIPVVDIGYKGSWIRANTIVVRLIDMLTKKLEGNVAFKRVEDAGGIHNYLNFNGKVIFSTVMRDDLIDKFSPLKYAQFIESVKPDESLTVDGYTYHNDWRARSELLRTLSHTEELMSICRNMKFIGIVKGSTEDEIDFHSSMLRAMGVNDMVFHIADYFRHGDPFYIRQSRSFCHIIRNKCKKLYLYGFGCHARKHEFSFADGCMTFTHVTTAKRGMSITSTRNTNEWGDDFNSVVINNFRSFEKEMSKINFQKDLGWFINGSG